MVNESWCEALDAGAVLVTVNQRLSRYYMHRYNLYAQASGNVVWQTPRILPWHAWLASQLAQLALSGRSQDVLMPAVVQQQLWRDCVEADKPTNTLLDEHGAARQAMDAWQIAHAWRCLPDDDDKFLPADQAAFARWSQEYKKRCKAMRRIDEARLPDYLATLIKEDPTATELPSQVLMAGFLELTPQQQDWVSMLESRDCTVAMLEPVQSSTSTAIAYKDDENELLSVASSVRASLEQNPAQRLGVVIPNLHQRRAACLRFFDQQFFPALNPAQIETAGRPYDISLGTPLDEQAVVKAAVLSLQIKLGVLRESTIAEFILSPYLASEHAESRDREKLDRQLRQNRVEQVSLNGLIKEIKAAPAQLKEALGKVSKINTQKTRGCAAWSVVFGQILDTLAWPGKGIGSSEYQAVQSWKRCLDDLQLLDNGQSISAGKALVLLREILRDRLFALETPLMPVQIMGRLESHGIEFDQLWVCGMDASQWPAPASANPFLSIARQKELGVPQADATTRLQLAEKEVNLWLGSATSVVFSFSKTRDGAEILPSALFTTRSIAIDDAAQQAADNPAQQINASIELTAIADTHGIPVPDKEAVRGGARLLENQSACPFRAYALHRLSIRPLEDAGLGLDARQHGTMLHRALELFWTNIKTSATLAMLSEEQLDAEIDSVTEQALNEMELGKALRKLEHKRLHRLISEWIEQQEKTREAPFEVVAFEQSCEIEQNGIVLNLMVDRIDRLATGELLVIDYKTGIRNNINDWQEERIKSPQLPLYSQTDPDIKGVTFAQVARHENRFAGLGENKYVPGIKASDDWDETTRDWQRKLNLIAGEISDGVATITPAKKACEFCDVLPLCRIEKPQFDEGEELSSESTGGGA